MAIDVVIKQKLFGKKTMPLEVILGDSLAYGYWENDQLTEEKLGDTEFIAYNPHAIGRGFSVIWNPRETKIITLRLPIPSTRHELRDFYDSISRMVTYWGASLIVDGNKMNPTAFLSGYEDMVTYNDKTLHYICRQILDGENDNLTLYSAKWPLTIGKEEAERFEESPDSFSSWLHEKQAMDVFFCNPRFFMGDEGVFGQFMLMNDLPTVFPVKPNVPFGMTDPNTGKPLECRKWTILLLLEHNNDFMKEMDYQALVDMIPDSKKRRYDANHFLLEGFSMEEILRFANM